MSNTNFTPGPWVVYPETDGREIFAVDRTEGLPIRQRIADVTRGKNWIDNGSLIAAAPDLYEALEEFLEVWGSEQEIGPHHPTLNKVLDALDKARRE